MITPNSLYDDTTLHGGISLTTGDILKIFCDITRSIKVRRSMIKLQLDDEILFFTLSDPDIILKINGTVVVVRGTKRDLSKVYIFDSKTDVFICTVNQNIKVYGDVKSMTDDDRKEIFKHSRKIKSIDRECSKRLSESKINQDDDLELEVFNVNDNKV